MDMQQLNRQTAKVNHYPTKVIQFGEGVLAAEFIWGEDLNAVSGLTDMLAEDLALIQNEGMRAAVKSVI